MSLGETSTEGAITARQEPREPRLYVLAAAPLSHGLLGQWLDDGERGRLNGLRRNDDRDRFATSRALLKTLVASVQGVDPGAVQLRYRCFRCGKPHGRPVVVAPAEVAGLHVSLSHAGSRVVVAATSTGPVGVDVEPAGAASFSGFADLVLTGVETTWVERAPVEQRDRARTSYWVRKESVLKATGYGLSLPATAVEVSAPDQPPRLVAWHSGDAPAPPPAVHLWDIDVGPGHVACVAVLAEVAPALQVRTEVSVALAP